VGVPKHPGRPGDARGFLVAIAPKEPVRVLAATPVDVAMA
jgi:hypothetical protein